MIGRVALIVLILSAWVPQENNEFFVKNGEPQALVVYGEEADFESAKIIAEKIAEMSKKEESVYTFKEENYRDKNDQRTPHCDFIAVGSTSGYFNEKPYINLPLWYDDKNLNGELDNDESREEIFIRFSEENNLFPIFNMGDLTYRTVIEYLPLKRTWKKEEKSVHIYDTPRKVQFFNQELAPLDFFQSITGNVLLLGDPYKETFPVQQEIELRGWKVQIGEEYIVTEPNGKSHNFEPNELICLRRTICSSVETAIFAMKIENGGVSIYVLRNYAALKDTIGIQIGENRWMLSLRSSDVEYEDTEDRTPSFHDGDTEYTIELRNYSRISGTVYLTELQIPPCGITEGAYTGRIFFSLETTDSDPNDKTIDKVEMTYKKVIETSFLTFMKRDTEITENITEFYNIISVGGPGYTRTGEGTQVCNTWTKNLVENEFSEKDWYNSEGEWEYIEEKKTLIIAGKDREATREAAEKLVESL
ncbi:MAG: hypothetical protein U9N35_04950 [Euryarchaeota archaeon]|nr:hypothetical protein [Euryarchaeota archaeon]